MFVHELINCGRNEDIAIVDNGRTFSYAQAKFFIKKFRNHLYALGIRQGDRVALFSRNSAEFIFTYLATASLGAICVPINFQLSTREIFFILQDAEINHILTYTPLNFEEFDAKDIYQHDIENFAYFDGNDAPELPNDFDENNPCAIIYTSGTTGNPKGAVLSHKNLVKNVEQINILKCSRENKILCVLPMYHCFGWTCCVLYSLYCGAQIFILRAFKHRETVDLIRNEKITDLYAVPSIYRLITTLGNCAISNVQWYDVTIKSSERF